MNGYLETLAAVLGDANIAAHGLAWTLAGLGFIFSATCAGAAVVGFFREPSSGRFQKIFLGFAAGVMVAASIWSLLIPAIEEAEGRGGVGWVPAAGGFLLGVAFLFVLEKVTPHLHPDTGTIEGPRGGRAARLKRSTLLISAVTLHNIPEGMAVGLSFALATQHAADPALFASALALALGIGIQNFPEGAAVSLPLRQEGASRLRAFGLGVVSGAVEPVAGIATFLLASAVAPFMSWLLSFAAGAMMYVVVEELVPEAHLGEHNHVGTLGFMAGFLIMMILDVALG